MVERATAEANRELGATESVALTEPRSEPRTLQSTLRKTGRKFRLPIIAGALLLAMCLPVPSVDLDLHHKTFFEIFAHHLGHEINSIWVGVTALLLTIPGLLALRRGMRDQSAWWFLDFAVVEYFVVDCVFKALLPWGRPYHPHQNGFPSGHTSCAFAMAWFIWQKYPKLGPLWFAMAVLIGWSRVEVHAHYNYQVFAGALLGTLLGWMVSRRSYGVILPRVFLPERLALQH